MERTPLQKYLDQGNNPAKLQEEFGINSYEHPFLPLIGFKYDQIDSPKTSDVVRWARGTVLEKGSWNLVAQSFVRFFNLGEGPKEDLERFDWSNFRCWTKMDGSLIIMYHWAGEWHANTSGSFGLGPINSHDPRSWRDVVKEVSTLDHFRMDPAVTYVFELCTPANKIIRHYPVPTLTMLGAYRGPSEIEWQEVKELAKRANATLVEEHAFRSKSEIEEFLAGKERTDATFEGVVIRDRNGIRYKVKSRTYLGLAHMYGNGQLGRPKRILPFVLAGETSEIKAYFPELDGEIREVEQTVEAEYQKFLEVWKQFRGIENQKEFALAIRHRTDFSGILFRLRKELGTGQTEESLRKAWRNSGDLILKVIYK